ncbi:MAG: YncE family protein [Reyranella sp.]|uniref:YncE family protein n=1 Tax=Reyranella sp. TaxID=1929291 RepID=UPI0012194329|nr:YncE family protein [Reyranella sp.]TAJ88592.1 MAG: YncE family protein [Reyranella sp.]TBR28052.1 MAG: YncE family protein [Reyranella sp.]
MTRLSIAALALLLVTSEAARADSVLVLNSEEASYSILSRSTRTEVTRLPVGREPHHLILSPDGKEVLIGSTATNELLSLDIKTGERKRVVKDILDPYHLGFSPDGKWFVTAAYRLDHVDIYHADGFRLAGRIFIDGLPSHIAFDTQSKTVFVTLQQSGRLAAFDLATQTLKWNVPVGNAPAGVVMLPDDKRLLVALTGEDGIVQIDPRDGSVKGSLQTGKGAHNFFPKGDGRHYFLSNRVEGVVSLIDTKDELKVVGSVRIPGGPDCMDITPDGRELWVTQRFLRRVAIVDVETLKVVGNIHVGKSPHGVFMLKSTATVTAGAPVRAASTAGEIK